MDLGQTYDSDTMWCEFLTLNNRRTTLPKLDLSCQYAVGCEIAGFVDKERYKWILWLDIRLQEAKEHFSHVTRNKIAKSKRGTEKHRRHRE
jgi:hypothetical protein